MKLFVCVILLLVSLIYSKILGSLYKIRWITGYSLLPRGYLHACRTCTWSTKTSQWLDYWVSKFSVDILTLWSTSLLDVPWVGCMYSMPVHLSRWNQQGGRYEAIRSGLAASNLLSDQLVLCLLLLSSLVTSAHNTFSPALHTHILIFFRLHSWGPSTLVHSLDLEKYFGMCSNTTACYPNQLLPDRRWSFANCMHVWLQLASLWELGGGYNFAGGLQRSTR